MLLLEQAEPDIRAAEAAVLEALRIARDRGARMLELRSCLTRLQIHDTGARDTANLSDLEAIMRELKEGRDAPDWQAASAYQ